MSTTSPSRSGLLVDAQLLTPLPDAAAIAFLLRMNAASVAVIAIGAAAGSESALRATWADRGIDIAASAPLTATGLRAKTLLGILRDAGTDVLSSWLVSPDPSVIAPAAQAGLAGVILVGVDAPPGDHGLVVNRADNLADVPRVLVPRDGGCWHQR